ncbi:MULTISPECIES: hypothetical protein [unclassified Luteimonas]|uniref:hypothetical protein n=1 Tax=Lysobacteraceae TaxID=32033 RepID=UPI00100BD516|nr:MULTISPECIES: hypothetical protein [unclassified Luteimonas]MCD9045385.1 hypothetical protein [Luteimonas sp. MHLX1A]
MRPASHRDPASSPLLYAALLGLMFLAVVAMLSLPAARGGSAIGLLPLWLLVLPAASLVALLVRDRLLAPSPITATGAARRRPLQQAQRRRATRATRPRPRVQAA